IEAVRPHPSPSYLGQPSPPKGARVLNPELTLPSPLWGEGPGVRRYACLRFECVTAITKDRSQLAQQLGLGQLPVPHYGARRNFQHLVGLLHVQPAKEPQFVYPRPPVDSAPRQSPANRAVPHRPPPERRRARCAARPLLASGIAGSDRSP